MARPLKNLCEVAVIGGGLAGLSAARHAARLGRLVTLFENSGIYGGQVATVDHVDGLPMPGNFSGQDLAIAMLEEARKVGVRVIEAQIDRLSSSRARPGTAGDLAQAGDDAASDPGFRRDDAITLTDWEGATYQPEAVILASGASLRKLGVPGEEQFTGRGVSRCASCDGGFYRGKDVVVVGGGDAAVHEALVLARTSRTVFMVCRSPLKAQREYIDRLDARENVRFVWDSEVVAIEGEGKVAGVRLRNCTSGAESLIEAEGVFPFIGVEPNTAYLPADMRDAAGCALAGDPRIVPVGALRADYGGMAVQAMAEGVAAAQQVHELLAKDGVA